MDEDGYVWYEGRADDVIIAAGYRIGPFEVESVCLEHPAVAEAAAVASPDERRGSVVKAFVVLAEGQEPSERAGRGDQGLRPRTPLRLRLPAADRVRRRAAEDADREDPADRAAPARGRATSGAGSLGDAPGGRAGEHDQPVFTCNLWPPGPARNPFNEVPAVVPD